MTKTLDDLLKLYVEIHDIVLSKARKLRAEMENALKAGALSDDLVQYFRISLVSESLLAEILQAAHLATLRSDAGDNATEQDFEQAEKFKELVQL